MTLSVLVVGGAGVMGTRAVQALVVGGYSVTVADLEPAAVAGVRTVSLDLMDTAALAKALDGHDLVANFAGPYYRFGGQVLGAAIAAGLHYIDVCDDAAAAEPMLALSDDAERAGVCAITGAGCSPGVANGFAMLLGAAFESIDAIDVCWVQGDKRPGGRAPLEHFFYGIDREIPVWTDGGRDSILPFRTPGQREFPFQQPIGPYQVLDVGHPETITLPAALPVRNVRNKGALVPSGSTAIFQMLRGVGLLSGTAVTVGGATIEARTFISQFLTDRHNAAVARNPQPSVLGIGVEVRGTLNGADGLALISMANEDAMDDSTAVPLVAAIGQLASGDLPPGVRGPEVLDIRRWFADITRLAPDIYGGIEIDLPGKPRHPAALNDLARYVDEIRRP